MKKLGCYLILTSMLLSLASCSSGKNSSEQDSKEGSSTQSVQDSDATYTYRQMISTTPSNFNPHDMSSDYAYTVLGYTSRGFVGVGMDSDKNFIRTYEMSDSIDDVTFTYTDKAKFGIGDDAKNRVWRIKLKKDAKWENGDPINADTYIYSMQQLLDVKMKNPRATQFTDDSVSAIVNAKEYMYSGQKVPSWMEMDNSETEFKDGRAYDKGGNALFYSVDETVPVLGMTLAEVYEAKPEKFKDEDGTDYFEILKNNTETQDGFCVVTEDILPALKFVAGGLGNSDLWYVMTFFEVEYSATWDDVGFIKEDDYTLIYITAAEVEKSDLLGKMSTCFIVHPDTYEKCKTVKGDLVTTNYGTSPETYMSCGPYKLVSFENDKQIVFTKNENWFGYSDPAYEGMYQTTDIRCDVIPSHESQMERFLMGEADDIQLTADDMKRYKYSDDLLKMDESMVFSFCFNTDIDELKRLEERAGDGKNRRVGAYDSFREAFSYAINRKDFTENATAGSKPQFGLLNSMYYYDFANDENSVYRNTNQAMNALVSHYGLEYGEGKDYKTLEEACNSITGFDLEKARTLFDEVYEKMKGDGNYADGQDIFLLCIASEQQSLTDEKKSQEALINKYIDEATKGTGFEDKIDIQFTCSQTMYNDFVNGNSEMILTVKYGADMSPYYQISKYVDVNNFVVPESKAYDPDRDEFTLKVGGNEETRTVSKWTKSINAGGDYVNSANDVKLDVLAGIEQYLIDQYVDIPIYSRCTVMLDSKKVEQGSDVYNPFYEFGGIAYMTYNYTDAEWEKFVANNPDGISYE